MASAAAAAASKAAAAIPSVPHPFYPTSISLVGYLANDRSTLTLLGLFAVACAVILSAALLATRTLVPSGNRAATTRNITSSGRWDTATMLWFTLCGFIHLFFEGYFAWNYAHLSSRQDLFGQMWKEYSLSDSRYLTADPFVLCMESVTAALWGPLSFLTAALIATGSPYRHPLQALVSTGQLYGDVLYYATNYFDVVHRGLSFSRPEAFYFWGYYIGLNAFWIVIPGLLIWSSMKATAKAFKIAHSPVTAVNGSAKKHT